MFKNYGDITKIDGSKVETVDCVIGGSPCQDLSIAGSKQGLSGSQSRLFLEQMRVIEEMRISSNGTKPRYMVWENVTNSLSCSKGKDFQCVLMECINVAIRTSSNRGGKEYETENNQTETNERKQIPDVPMPKNGKWPKSGILYDDLGRWSIAWRVHDAQYWGVVQRRRRIAFVVDFGGMSAPEVLFEPKSSTRDINESNTQREGVTERITRSIAESNRESSEINKVFTYDARGNGDGKITATLTGDHDNRITDYTNVIIQEKLPVYCIGNGQSHVTQHYTKEVSQTLNCMHDTMTILEPKEHKYFVRRLTPLEETRLQGFPDHWVDVGEWVDSKGKKHKETDAPKYKALGNSIALPFWKWLCRNIVNKIKEANRDVDYIPTMASLFAGIGGFDLCWMEATNNKDSVLWDSEIEEFPIAVLKHNFG